MLLEQQLGQPVRAFAYPVGKPEHFGEQGLEAVKAAGYTWALTTMQGMNIPQSDPYHLRRVSGDVSRHWLVMAVEASGIWHIFSPLWKKKPLLPARGPVFLNKPVVHLSELRNNDERRGT